MKTLNLILWWSLGCHGLDSDGREEEIEVTDEQYEVFKELYEQGEDAFDEIDDPRVADFCKETTEELYETLYDDSAEYEMDVYRDDCLIDPDDPEYDKDGPEEQFTESLRDWWFDRYSLGIRIETEFDEEDEEDAD